MLLNREEIIEELKAERRRIDLALKALGEIGSDSGGTRRGRKPGTRMSAAARARISAAMKKRWLARRKEK